MTDSPIRNHLRQYLKANNTTIGGLERRSGMASGGLNLIMNGRREMSPKTLKRLAPFVHWTPECEAECTANVERYQRLRHNRKSGAEPIRVPWPVTRDHAKSGRHLYATVRMLP